MSTSHSVINSEPPLVKDALFAPLDEDLYLARIAGGNETEVYATDDLRYVVKIKNHEDPTHKHTLDAALAEAKILRDAAERNVACVGEHHSVPTYVIIAANDDGECHPIVVQPFLRNAKPLIDVNCSDLSPEEKQALRHQLTDIIRRSVKTLFTEGWMPDLYGRTSTSKSERSRLNHWTMLPWRLWSFLVQRNLLCSHNLMMTPDNRVVLIDYDPMHQSRFYQLIYYCVRLGLFARDLLILWVVLSPRLQRSAALTPLVTLPSFGLWKDI